MGHGFLGFDAPGGMKYASKCILDCCEYIRELLNPCDLETKNKGMNWRKDIRGFLKGN